jgi:hypothetical protein
LFIMSFLTRVLQEAYMMPRHPVAALCLFLTMEYLCAFPLCAGGEPRLTIEILRGENGNNNAVTGSSVSPVIRVSDAEGKPVRSAAVVFSAPLSGASINFAGAGPLADVLTDETGTAIAPHFAPAVANGPVEIRILATKDGLSANVSIFQMNLGVGKAIPQGDDLEVFGFTEVQTTQKARGLRGFQVLVVETAGKPVAGASVVFRVRDANNSGRWEPLNPEQAVSDSNGMAAAEMRRKPARRPLEFSVRATVGGRHATRYFILDH